MPTATIFFEKEEDDKIEILAKKWNLSKMMTIKRIILLFEDIERGK